MKIFISSMLLIVIAASCGHKEEVLQPAPPAAHPSMKYIDLHNSEVKFNQPQHLDLDGDGRRDFTVSTLHIGDPGQQREIIQFMVTSPAERFAMADENNNAPVFHNGDIISEIAPQGIIWYEIVASVLSEKVIELSGNTFWQGTWMQASNKYFPFYFQKNAHRYYGWLELSMDISQEKIMLHRAALCNEPGKAVKAGI